MPSRSVHDRKGKQYLEILSACLLSSFGHPDFDANHRESEIAGLQQQYTVSLRRTGVFGHYRCRRR